MRKKGAISFTDGAIKPVQNGELKEGEGGEKREGWGSHIEFILSCVGYSVGLGNVWRFPYLAYKNGGGAFVIPYIISVILAGLPLYFLELALGQFSSYGTNLVFSNISPIFEGIGIGMSVVSLLVGIYYNIIITWVLFYFFSSFRGTLLWQGCRSDWNTELCQSNLEDNWCKEQNGNTSAVFFNKTCYNMTDELNVTLNSLKRVAPADEFFNIYMLNRSNSFEEMGSMSWKLVLCLGLAWILVFLCLCKGVQSTGKVVYFTATFPYVVLLILLIRGATLEGAAQGLLFYVKPDVTRLQDWRVWKDAAEQVFFSLGPAFGGLMTMASYNKFNTNCRRDAIMISFIDSFTSTFAGCAIFSATGFLANELQKPIENVTSSGMALAFIAYPEAIARMPVPPLWSILFFFMLITLGMDSEFAMLETVTTAIIDGYPKLRRFKLYVVATMCFIMFLFGLPFCCQGGIYLFLIMNDYSAGYCVIVLALFECIVVSYVYGIRRFCKDVEMMLGSKAGYYWMVTLAGVTPVYLIFVLVAGMVKFEATSYGDYILPKSAQGLGIAFSLVSIGCIPAFAIYRICKFWMERKKKMDVNWKSLIAPTANWCPASERHEEETTRSTATISAVRADIVTKF